ncbi:hypothetical protein KBC40_03125 [Patescibacteria group bacterium]|nr:hypothetical protein [Patescibacteria group bacterium]
MKIKIIISSLYLFLLAFQAKAIELYNPLCEKGSKDCINSFPQLVNSAIRGILGITGAIALVMIVIGGITWMTSAGNADRVRRGKDTLLWSILGLLIIFLSYAIINFVLGALAA